VRTPGGVRRTFEVRPLAGRPAWLELAFGALAAALLVSSCACETGPVGCTETSECTEGRVCRAGRCEAAADTGSESREDAGPVSGRCETALCGTPPQCCAEGTECVSGECLPACASGVRCAAACCEAGDVCVSERCTPLGLGCEDSFDCPSDAFCEPTLGRCLPQFDPLTCTRAPDDAPFEPVLEWSFTAATEFPDALEVMTIPLVVDLDTDGAPEVIVATYRPLGTTWPGTVRRILRGADGTLVRSIASAGDGVMIDGCVSMAAGDLDGDARPEIVVVASGQVRALRGDGSLLWDARDRFGMPHRVRGGENAALAIADLDQDGTPEVVLGASAYDATGLLLWERDAGANEGSNRGYQGGMSVIADIDLDGRPEVVTGRRAYRADGTALWVASDGTPAELPDGYPAIGSFDGDPQPEVVLVASGSVFLLDGVTGMVEWAARDLAGVFRGGSPTCADFAGDGGPGIGLAGGTAYPVRDPGRPSPIVWSDVTQDGSSAATGSSVFDFQGDGAAEVLYADECYLRAYRGLDGAHLFELANLSATRHELPTVVDVDGDGHAEILVVANAQYTTVADTCRLADPTWDGARAGVFVYGDRYDRWVRTRRVWNQHGYHVTNVEPDGTVPRVEANNWETAGLNNFRQNTQGAGLDNAADLRVLALEVALVGCPETVALRARIQNAGQLGVPAGVSVTFREGTLAAPGEILGVVRTEAALLPGATTVVSLTRALDGSPPYAFTASVDDDGMGSGAVAECDEENNVAAIGGVDCELLF